MDEDEDSNSWSVDEEYFQQEILDHDTREESYNRYKHIREEQRLDKYKIVAKVVLTIMILSLLSLVIVLAWKIVEASTDQESMKDERLYRRRNRRDTQNPGASYEFMDRRARHIPPEVIRHYLMLIDHIKRLDPADHYFKMNISRGSIGRKFIDSVAQFMNTSENQDGVNNKHQTTTTSTIQQEKQQKIGGSRKSSPRMQIRDSKSRKNNEYGNRMNQNDSTSFTTISSFNIEPTTKSLQIKTERPPETGSIKTSRNVHGTSNKIEAVSVKPTPFRSLILTLKPSPTLQSSNSRSIAGNSLKHEVTNTMLNMGIYVAGKLAAITTSTEIPIAPLPTNSSATGENIKPSFSSTTNTAFPSNTAYEVLHHFSTSSIKKTTPRLHHPLTSNNLNLLRQQAIESSLVDPIKGSSIISTSEYTGKTIGLEKRRESSGIPHIKSFLDPTQRIKSNEMSSTKHSHREEEKSNTMLNKTNINSPASFSTTTIIPRASAIKTRVSSILPNFFTSQTPSRKLVNTTKPIMTAGNSLVLPSISGIYSVRNSSSLLTESLSNSTSFQEITTDKSETSPIAGIEERITVKSETGSTATVVSNSTYEVRSSSIQPTKIRDRTIPVTTTNNQQSVTHVSDSKENKTNEGDEKFMKGMFMTKSTTSLPIPAVSQPTKSRSPQADSARSTAANVKEILLKTKDVAPTTYILTQTKSLQVKFKNLTAKKVLVKTQSIKSPMSILPSKLSTTPTTSTLLTTSTLSRKSSTSISLSKYSTLQSTKPSTLSTTSTLSTKSSMSILSIMSTLSTNLSTFSKKSTTSSLSTKLSTAQTTSTLSTNSSTSSISSSTKSSTSILPSKSSSLSSTKSSIPILPSKHSTLQSTKAPTLSTTSNLLTKSSNLSTKSSNLSTKSSTSILPSKSSTLSSTKSPTLSIMSTLSTNSSTFSKQSTTSSLSTKLSTAQTTSTLSTKSSTSSNSSSTKSSISILPSKYSTLQSTKSSTLSTTSNLLRKSSDLSTKSSTSILPSNSSTLSSTKSPTLSLMSTLSTNSSTFSKKSTTSSLSTKLPTAQTTSSLSTKSSISILLSKSSTISSTKSPTLSTKSSTLSTKSPTLRIKSPIKPTTSLPLGTSLSQAMSIFMKTTTPWAGDTYSPTTPPTELSEILRDKRLKQYIKNIIEEHLSKKEVTTTSTPQTTHPPPTTTLALENQFEIKWVCRSANTFWNSPRIIGFLKFFLDAQMKCKDNEYLKSFQFVDNHDIIYPLYRYNYECCQAKLHRKSGVAEQKNKKRNTYKFRALL